MDWILIAGAAAAFYAIYLSVRQRQEDGNERAVLLPPAEYSEDRAARLTYIMLYVQRAIQHDMRARFCRKVDRAPYFTVPRGATGQILMPRSDPDDDRLVLRVRLDVPVPGSEEFCDEVHWKEDVNLENFEKDVVFYRPSV